MRCIFSAAALKWSQNRNHWLHAKTAPLIFSSLLSCSLSPVSLVFSHLSFPVWSTNNAINDAMGCTRERERDAVENAVNATVKCNQKEKQTDRKRSQQTLRAAEPSMQMNMHYKVWGEHRGPRRCSWGVSKSVQWTILVNIWDPIWVVTLSYPSLLPISSCVNLSSFPKELPLSSTIEWLLRVAYSYE